MAALLELAEAQARALKLVRQAEPVTVPAAEAVGLYLASDLAALRTQPPADLSAMDGYAVTGNGPWRLVGESRAGAPFAGRIAQGECVRISTGAHMPEGSDRVLIQENAATDGEKVMCTQDMPSPGRHVRRRGFDFTEGDLVLKAGCRIDAPQLALAMSAGHGSLAVRNAPVVAVLDSGDELAADPRECRDDQIPASNGAMIGAMLRELGCDVVRIGPVGDSLPELAGALAKAERADFLVTSGGASVGDHDLIRPALEAWGAKIDFWKVAIKPGKPLMMASRGEQIVIGLPGNPVSSFVTCYLFVLPMVRAMMGAVEPLPRVAKLPLGASLPPVGSRREFLRARWDGMSVSPSDSQDSSALAALAASNCLIERPANAGAAAAGGLVPCYLLQNGGIA